MIDIYAPVIPYVGAGGLSLGIAKEMVEQELMQQNFSSEVYENDVLLYSDEKTLELCFSLPENLLCRITALSGYKGKLFEKIEMGMPEDEIQRIEPTFVYDDFREVYETPKGAIIETDLPAHTVAWISVFQKEED